jgi:Putative Actinobacterial Holin-X, holin superfamily III
MAEKHLPTSERVSANQPDWATLIKRALDDVSRILRSEIQILQTSLRQAVEAQVSRAVVRLTVIAAMACGAVCLLCAIILLIHQWLPLWQSFGLVGIVTLAGGLVGQAIIRTSRTV